MDQLQATDKRSIGFSWLLKMAWRDSRRNRGRLLLFISSIIIGITALVAIFSLEDNVRRDIDNQAKALVGADLVIDNNRLPDTAIAKLIDSLGDERSKQCSFASMIYFKKSNGTRLVEVLALEGNYPYYGSFETIPQNAGTDFRELRQALVDKTLMLQYNAGVGDTIQIGELDFTIAGILTQAPGRTGISTTIAAPVYIPFRYLEQTRLLQKGSRFKYTYYFKYASATQLDRQLNAVKETLDKTGWDYDTAESRKKQTSRQFDDLSKFLTLVGFIALLLGCIGIASSINIYIREKINSIAVLRCLGASGIQTFLIYLIQIGAIGFIGAVTGAMLGTIAQQLLPFVLKDLLPVQITTSISWGAIMKGIGLGVVISLLFGLLPLLSIRNISPLYTLRISLELRPAWKDPLQLILFGIILFFVCLFARMQMESWMQAVVFTTAILMAFILLTLFALLLRWTVKRFFPSSFSYVWRQGFANLYRPNNQTILLVVTIGLGTLFIGTLYFIQGTLMNRVSLSASGNQPNMVLFDIQSNQKQAVADLAKQFKLPLQQQVPIVTMRIEEINGKTAEDVRKDSSLRIPRRAFEGEIRVTYRDTLTDSEKLTAGKIDMHGYQQGHPIYISLEKGWADHIRANIGDSIVFNVQGALMPAVVGSIRDVDWQRVQTNFRVVFPSGVLENAPQFHVLVTRVPSSEVSASFQQAVVRQFPNISIIDLGLILKVLDEVLEKIGFVIRFMAGFSIATGLIVLIASVFVSKYQRMQESILLRTLGASRRQIYFIITLEYFFLGALAAGTGILLSLAGSWALAHFTFNAPFHPSWWPVIILFLTISSVTVLIGLFNSRDVVKLPPLEILRKEV
ncbi:MAG: ABC transporter permease [Terrimonas sp.]|nr:ABC transporter permease [Terrimonas sp.]OJY86317.1 MAG: ABC transporter permease [Sphingobacteriales bacterium 40-81]